MPLVMLLAAVAASYLFGSVNYAILITRRVAGVDIRSLGTRNAGTANVGRNAGKLWAALVLLLDILKGLIPLLLAKSFLFPGSGWRDTLALFAVGIAAVGGHCRPVFHRFKGGGGIATSLGIYFLFDRLPHCRARPQEGALQDRAVDAHPVPVHHPLPDHGPWLPSGHAPLESTSVG